MRKSFFFMLCILLLISCSDSSNDQPIQSNTLTVTIDGVTKTFNTFIFDNQPADPANTIVVTATIDNNLNEILIFYINEGSLGEEALINVEYELEATTYSVSAIGFGLLLTRNTNGVLQGSFWGPLASVNGENHIFSNGSFDLQY